MSIMGALEAKMIDWQQNRHIDEFKMYKKDVLV
jgi:hypothetical protein